VRFPNGTTTLLLAAAGRSKTDVKRRVWFFNSTRGKPVDIVEIVPVRVVTRAWPEPCREALQPEQRYFYVDPVCRVTAVAEFWTGDAEDMRLLDRGLIHLTLEAAQAHAEALLALSK
jgi:hypothetical protein